MIKAQVLLIVVLLMVTVAFLAGSLSSMLSAEGKSETQARYGLFAFYLAQAGIERAKIDADNGIIGNQGPYTLTGGRYSYSIQDLGGNNRQIISLGEAVYPSGAVAAREGITVRVRGIDDGSPNNQAQVPWSWRELELEVISGASI